MPELKCILLFIRGYPLDFHKFVGAVKQTEAFRAVINEPAPLCVC
jgi:hypothetical protein